MKFSTEAQLAFQSPWKENGPRRDKADMNVDFVPPRRHRAAPLHSLKRRTSRLDGHSRTAGNYTSNPIRDTAGAVPRPAALAASIVRAFAAEVTFATVAAAAIVHTGWSRHRNV